MRDIQVIHVKWFEVRTFLSDKRLLGLLLILLGKQAAPSRYPKEIRCIRYLKSTSSESLLGLVSRACILGSGQICCTRTGGPAKVWPTFSSFAFNLKSLPAVFFISKVPLLSSD